MHIFEILTLGVTQGLTEFIPVSSSGHLVIAQQLFSGASDHLYLEFINIGTLAALLV
jgi:undecaprenyl-diphosphatase